MRRRRSWIRSLLVLTCTGVSFAHGSNDGQKGMGLIVLILVGIVPAAFALNMSASRRLAAAACQSSAVAFSQSLAVTSRLPAAGAAETSTPRTSS